MMINIEVPIYGDEDEETLEYISISQRLPEIGEVCPKAFVSLHDDSEERVTYLVSQIDDIIDALKTARDRWEAQGGRYK